MSNSNAVANGLAGAGGGIIAQIITYPLQTVLSSTPFPSLFLSSIFFFSSFSLVFSYNSTE